MLLPMKQKQSKIKGEKFKNSGVGVEDAKWIKETKKKLKVAGDKNAFKQLKMTKQLCDAFLLLKTEQEVKHFLFDLLSPQVLGEAARRFRAAEMLSVFIPYETIQKETGLSSTTVAATSKWLKSGLGGYRMVIDRLKYKAELRRQLYDEASCIYPKNL